MRDIQIYDAILPPGIFYCHEKLPCTGFVMENVQADGWWRWVRLGYVSHNVYGTVKNSTPAPGFISHNGEGAYHAYDET